MENPFEIIFEKLDSIERMLFTLNQQNENLQTNLQKEFLTLDEIAEYLNLKKQTIYRRVHEGTLPYSKIGGRLYFSMEDVRKLIKGNRKDFKDFFKIL